METIKIQISETVQKVIDGEIDPLEVYAELNILNKYIKTAMDEIKEEAFYEAVKYGKTFELKGFKFTVSEGKASYNYREIPQWKEMKDEMKKLEEKAKASARNYQQFKSYLVEEESGEIIPPCVITYSKPSISISKIN